MSLRDPSGHCIFTGIDTLICAGVALTIYEAIALLTAAGIATYATYEACITQHGCARLAIDIDTYLQERTHTGHPPAPPADAHLPGTSQRTPGRGENIQLGPHQDSGDVCTTEQFPAPYEQPVKPLVFPLPEEQRGPTVMSVTPIRPARKFVPSDAAALKQFGKDAQSLGGSNRMRQQPWGALVWNAFADQPPDGLFVYDSGDRITGAMTLSHRSMYPDALSLGILEALPGRAFVGLLKAAILESIAQGYEGRVVGSPADQALENYINAGAVAIPHTQDYLLTEQKAQEFLKRFP